VISVSLSSSPSVAHSIITIISLFPTSTQMLALFLSTTIQPHIHTDRGSHENSTRRRAIVHIHNSIRPASRRLSLFSFLSHSFLRLSIQSAFFFLLKVAYYERAHLVSISQSVVLSLVLFLSVSFLSPSPLSRAPFPSGWCWFSFAESQGRGKTSHGTAVAASCVSPFVFLLYIPSLLGPSK
jgi:hypothetical protein